MRASPDVGAPNLWLRRERCYLVAARYPAGETVHCRNIVIKAAVRDNGAGAVRVSARVGYGPNRLDVYRTSRTEQGPQLGNGLYRLLKTDDWRVRSFLKGGTYKVKKRPSVESQGTPELRTG